MQSDERCGKLPVPVSPPPFRVADASLGELAATVCALLNGREAAADLAGQLRGRSGPVYGELRSSGRLVQAGWAAEGDQWTSLCRLLRDLRGAADQASTLLVCFTHRPRMVAIGSDAGWKRFTANLQRGLVAYELQRADRPDQVLRISPLAIIAQNREMAKTLQQIAEQSGLTVAEARSGAITVREFDTEQFLINLSRGDSPAVRLFRGTRLVPLSDITRESIAELERLLSGYLVRSVQPNGRMTYVYYPSRGCEDQTLNNSIRQWMATRVLVRSWQRSQASDLLPVLQRNITYNLQLMYREENGLGLIIEGEKVKLGAVALAALAIAESPFAGDLADVYQRLLATVDRLWTNSGQFRSFLRPAERMDCQNFYPGEALLLWSNTIAKCPDEKLIRRFWTSFEFYQAWHSANRNPAFIPWHTQAYWTLWKCTADSKLAQAIFEMNDWLLAVQQWDSAPCPDCRGRFYDPNRPFGPPHASSTAVYLEGLADAFALARELGESDRAERYRVAIVRGLRSIVQLTFKDEADLFYVTKRDWLRGGVRTTEYNNVVRVDNVQHALMAIGRVLDVFSDDDFQLHQSRDLHARDLAASKVSRLPS